MSGYVLKPADAALTYVLDWREGYLDGRETIVDDLGWQIRHSDGLSTLLAVAEQHHDFHRTWAEFSGGTPGRFYLVSSHIRTSRNRIVDRSIVLRVAASRRSA